MSRLIYRLMQKSIIPEIFEEISNKGFKFYWTNIENLYLTNYDPLTKEKCQPHVMIAIFLKKRMYYGVYLHKDFLVTMNIEDFKELFKWKNKKLIALFPNMPPRFFKWIHDKAKVRLYIISLKIKIFDGQKSKIKNRIQIIRKWINLIIVAFIEAKYRGYYTLNKK